MALLLEGFHFLYPDLSLNHTLEMSPLSGGLTPESLSIRRSRVLRRGPSLLREQAPISVERKDEVHVGHQHGDHGQEGQGKAESSDTTAPCCCHPVAKPVRKEREKVKKCQHF